MSMREDLANRSTDARREIANQQATRLEELWKRQEIVEVNRILYTLKQDILATASQGENEFVIMTFGLHDYDHQRFSTPEVLLNAGQRQGVTPNILSGVAKAIASHCQADRELISLNLMLRGVGYRPGAVITDDDPLIVTTIQMVISWGPAST